MDNYNPYSLVPRPFLYGRGELPTLAPPIQEGSGNQTITRRCTPHLDEPNGKYCERLDAWFFPDHLWKEIDHEGRPSIKQDQQQTIPVPFPIQLALRTVFMTL